MFKFITNWKKFKQSPTCWKINIFCWILGPEIQLRYLLPAICALLGGPVLVCSRGNNEMCSIESRLNLLSTAKEINGHWDFTFVSSPKSLNSEQTSMHTDSNDLYSAWWCKENISLKSYEIRYSSESFFLVFPTVLVTITDS